MENPTKKRFIKSLRSAMEDMAQDACAFCYQNDPEYLEVINDLKYALRKIENDEVFAGKLLYKQSQRMGHGVVRECIQKARTADEQEFFIYLDSKKHQQARRTGEEFGRELTTCHVWLDNRIPFFGHGTIREGDELPEPLTCDFMRSELIDLVQLQYPRDDRRMTPIVWEPYEDGVGICIRCITSDKLVLHAGRRFHVRYGREEYTLEQGQTLELGPFDDM